MGDHQHRASIVLQVVFEPLHRFRIQVVGRLVQQQDRGLLDQQAGERHAALLAARQVLDRPVAGRAAQGLHRHFELVVERPAVNCVDLVLQLAHFRAERVEIGVRLAHQRANFVEARDQIGGFLGALAHVFEHGLGRIELGLLLEIADGDVLARPGLAGVVLVDPGHDLDERRLARAIGADDADLRALIELERDVVQHRLLRAGEGLGHALHDIGVLGGHRMVLRVLGWGKELGAQIGKGRGKGKRLDRQAGWG